MPNTGPLLFYWDIIVYCLVSQNRVFFFRVQCICISEPIRDSLSTQSMRKQRVHCSGYPELRTDMETCEEFCSTASYHMIQLCDSHTAFRVLLTCYFATLSFCIMFRIGKDSHCGNEILDLLNNSNATMHNSVITSKSTAFLILLQ